MAALQCEICGGKLIGKPGGLFECDSCGMEYSTEWAKAKIQEIKGTVKVEGTVQVAGTVKVEGGVSIENLLKKGRMALEDYKWEDAKKAFQDALDINAECGEAYLGQLLAEQRFVSFDQMLSRKGYYLTTHSSFKRALQFMNPADAKVLRDKADAYQRALEEEQEEKQRLEQAAKDERERRISLLAERRAEVDPANRLLRQRKGYMYVLTPDGKIRPADEDSAAPEYDDAMKEWSDIQKFEFVRNRNAGIFYDNVLILDVYGNVSLMDLHKVEVNDGKTRNSVHYFDREELVTDCSAVDICETWKYMYVLMENGTLECWEERTDFKGKFFRHWNVADNVKEIHSNGSFVCCKFADGKRQTLYDEGKPTDLLEENDQLLSSPSVCIDGTLVKDHNRYEPELEWNTVIDWAAHHGLMMDGTVYRSTEQKCEAVWQNVAAIKWGGITNDSVYAITNDGYLLNSDPEKKITVKQPLFESLEALKKSQARYTSAAERRKALEDLEKQKQQKMLESEKAVLQTELANLKGLFTGKRKKEIEARLNEIENELKELR